MEAYIKGILEEWNTEDITDEVDNKISFWSFNGRFSIYFRRQIFRILEERIQGEIDKIGQVLMENFYKKTYSISIRTMIIEIYQWKIRQALELDNTTPNERYLMFCRQFRDKQFFQVFCEKYSVLIRKIYLLHQYTLLLVEEAITALNADKNEIEKLFGFSVEHIGYIDLSDGDRHNNGKAALIFSDKNGKKIIYKPHTLSNDVFLKSVYTDLNRNLTFNLLAPKVINRKSYGWQEFIVKKECETDQEFCEYYYRYGEMLGIAYCLNMTDLHMDNLIMYGRYPVIIDTETIITNDSYNFDKNKVVAIDVNTPKRLFNHTISKSVFNTLLLPTNLLGGLFDVDLSPLAVDDSQISGKMTNFQVIDDFTDNIHLESICYQMKYEGKRDLQYNPSRYLIEILDGFTECYTYILENKEEFRKSIIRCIEENSLVIRQVLRPTYIYGRFEDASNHPDYLEDINKQVVLISKLKSKPYMQEEKMFHQADMEITSLLNGDIPYFFEEANSKDLKSIYGTIENFYKKTIIELVNEKIAFMNQEDLISQQRMINLSMSTLLSSNWNHNIINSAKPMKKYMPYLGKSDSTLVTCIADYICHEAVWNDKEEFCIIVSHALLTPKLKVTPLSYYLYDGGGVVLLLYRLALKTNNEKYYKVAEGLLKGFENSFNEDEVILSAYNGTGSMLYIYYTLYLLLEDMSYYEKYERCLEKIISKSIVENQVIDYINGLSGMAVLLENIFMIEKDVRLKERAREYVDYCIDHLMDMNLAGLAHGYSGLILAVAGYYNISKDEKYLNDVKRIIEIENQYYDEEKQNWKDLREDVKDSDPVYWCHGATGICLARLQAYKYTGLEICMKDIQKSIDKIEDSLMKLTDHSLCHGMLGNIDFLLSYGEILNSQEVLFYSLLNEKYNQVIQDMIDNGIVCGISNAYEMFSFMLGLPGIIYTILRKYHNEIPSILLLDVK